MGGNAGASTFPDQHGHFKDGVFIIHSALMETVIEHETGHYLGLYHPFDGPICDNNDCLNDNDKVCDTPPDSTAYFNQTCTANTCTSDEDDTSSSNPFRSTTLGGIGEQDDDTRNFMDVTICASKYTPGQKTRMLAGLNTMRSSLLTSQGCQFPLSASAIKENRIEVYPNPVGDQINIDHAEGSTISIFNILGQRSLSSKVLSNHYQVNTTSLQAGMYMLVLNIEGGGKEIMRFQKK